MARQQDDQATRTYNQIRDFLQGLAPKALKHRDRRIGEENTKATLIEPVLEALGWDIRDCDEVHREFRAKSADSPVDYALKIMRTPRLFLEAKGLGEDLSDRKWISQVLSYATVAGVEWCVLTDGDEWRFYNSTAAVDAEEKLFRRVRISDGDLDETAETLALLSRDNIEGNLLEPLWAAHFVDRKVKEALREMLESRDRGIVRLIHRKVPKLKPKQVVESLGRLEVRIDSPALRPPASTTAPSAPGSTPTHASGKPRRCRGGQNRCTSLVNLIAASKLKPPVRLFRRYKGQMMEATVLSSGEVEFGGQRYASLSAAAVEACATVTGRKMSADGWSFWRLQDQEGQERTLDGLRKALPSRE
ncbi:MAG TPA: DUF2924 domain-containing protein [Planctomycetota bacterium]|nr:DUF2924 domain-containing protein [Planctomycetota bacterium]